MKLEQNELDYFLHLLNAEIFTLAEKVAKPSRYDAMTMSKLDTKQSIKDLAYAVNMLKKLSEENKV